MVHAKSILKKKYYYFPLNITRLIITAPYKLFNRFLITNTQEK